jgi:hypothetical protein
MGKTTTVPEMMHCPSCHWAEPVERWSIRAKGSECTRCGKDGMAFATEDEMKRLAVAWCAACQTFHSS